MSPCRVLFPLCFLALSVFSVGELSAEEVKFDLKKVTLPSLSVSPSLIELTTVNRRQQITVTVVKDGREFDVTREAKVELKSEDVVQFSDGVLTATQDGKTDLIVTYGGKSVRVPIVSQGAATFPPAHFVNDIVPLFSKLGCNSGGCHGKASGQNGFKLSVFGFDAKADHASLSRESRGRRVFTGDPERSLLVLKAIGASAHGSEPNTPNW